MALSTFKFLALSLAFMSSTAKSELNDEFKVIETNNGKVRGVRQKTLLQNVEFYWFKGIPYAKSPTGELRFKVSFQKKKNIHEFYYFTVQNSTNFYVRLLSNNCDWFCFQINLIYFRIYFFEMILSYFK